ncbi:MAG: ABC transporter permease, partial [Oscillospiraceae bacterium]
AFLALFMTWFLDGDIFSSITSGNVAYELSRPMDLYNMWFIKNMALRLSKAVLRCFPILFVAIFLPQPYGLSFPPNILSFIMFLITMLLGFLTVIAFCMLIYIATFYTLSPLGVRIVALSLTEFLSGAIIPLPFLPDNVRRILELTPFASMQNLPFRIYSGNIAGSDVLFGIILQVFWLVTLLIVGKIWMEKALKRIVVQGG